MKRVPETKEEKKILKGFHKRLRKLKKEHKRKRKKGEKS